MKKMKFRQFEIDGKNFLGYQPEIDLYQIARTTPIEMFRNNVIEKVGSVVDIDTLLRLGICNHLLSNLLEELALLVERFESLNPTQLNEVKVFMGDGMTLKEAIEVSVKI